MSLTAKWLSLPMRSTVAPLDERPLETAVELLATRHEITAAEARWRIDRVAAYVGIADVELARLILRAEAPAGPSPASGEARAV